MFAVVLILQSCEAPKVSAILYLPPALLSCLAAGAGPGLCLHCGGWSLLFLSPTVLTSCQVSRGHISLSKTVET